MKTFKIPFAIDDDGSVVDIQNAVKSKNYKCTCGSDIKLRGGEIVSNHFYHTSEKECSLESSIHKAYKFVFQQTKAIKLPYEVNGSDFLEFDRVELEKKIGDFIPDAIGYIGDKMYLIEFAKSHFIGENKEKKIKESGLFCVELSIFKDVGDFDDIKEHLIGKSYFKRIINIPEYEEMKELKKEYLRLQSETEELKEDYKKTYSELYSEKQVLENRLKSMSNNVKKESFLSDVVKDVGLRYSLENGVHLEYKSKCKNGATFYASPYYKDTNLIAFLSEDGVSLTIKCNTK